MSTRNAVSKPKPKPETTSRDLSLPLPTLDRVLEEVTENGYHKYIMYDENAPRLNQEQARSILQRTASTISARADVQIHYTNDGSACTNGKDIYLPPPRMDDPRAWATTRGYVDHESAHLLYTDMKAMQNLDKLQAHCLNLVEDVRVNAMVRSRYPGSIPNLRTLYQSVCDETVKDAPALLTAPKTQRWLGAVQSDLERLAVMGLPSSMFGQDAEQFAQDFSPKIQAAIDSAKTTLDVLPIAKELAELVRDPNNKQQSEPNGPPTDANGNPIDSDGNAMSEKELAEAKQFSESPLGQLVKKIIQKQRGAFHNNYRSIVKPKFIPWQQWLKRVGKHTDKALTTLPHALTLGAGLRDNLKQALKAITLARTTRDRDTGDLDMGKLATLAARVNDPLMFTQTTPGHAVDTAIHVLLDASSSMATANGAVTNKWLATVSAATLFTDAAGACGASVMLSEFGEYDQAPVWCEHGERPTRNQWLDRMSKCKPIGGTPTGTHLQAAAAHLLTRPEPRKCLLVVTDGDPDDQDLLAHASNIAHTAGIELYGVGIKLHMHSAKRMSAIFRNAFVTINDLPQLRNALLNLLVKLLLKREGRR